MLDLSIPRIMIDLETMSSEKNAGILSLGAVQFGQGSHPDSSIQFYAKADPQDSERWGLHISKETMLWWDKQDASVREEAFSGTQPLSLLLTKFEQWVRDNFGDTQRVELWSKGADFDLVVLPHAYYTTLSMYPFNFRNHRCARTLMELMPPALKYQAELSMGVSGQHVGKHNALVDAKFQALMCNVALANLSFNPQGQGPNQGGY